MLIAVMILPLLLVGLIMSFSPAALFVVLIAVLVLWIIVRSYRDAREREHKEDTSP